MRKQYISIAIAFLIAAGIVSTSFLIKKNEVLAQSPGIIPFGGIIDNVQYCCDGSVLLVVGPPRPGVVIYNPEISFLYEYYDVLIPGPWVLGTSNPGGYCELVDADCEGGTVGNTISEVGTSAL